MQAPISPMSWYSGSQDTKTSLALTPEARAIARRLASRLAWVSTTPLGLPVLPEVYCRKADVFRARRRRQRRRRGARQVRHGRHRAQRGALRAQQMAKRLGARVGDQQRGLGVGDDAGDAAQVLLELRRPRRRVQRHRHAAGVERAIESGEEFAAGGQHDGDAVASNWVRRDTVASMIDPANL